MELCSPRTFWSAKAGNRPTEYEDAYRVVYPHRIGSNPGEMARVALSDGASESAFAPEWARSLSRHFVDSPPAPGHDGRFPGWLNTGWPEQWLAPAQEAWRRAVPWERIPWHGEAKTRAGAWATLLGLTFARPTGDARRLAWHAVAVGDSCLFLVRQGELVLSFPLNDPGQFNYTPDLLCSNPANNGRARDRVQRRGGTCRAGDRFILASDALAAWLLERRAAGERPWQTLLTMTAAQWPGWLQAQRAGRRMSNDDATLIIIPVA